MGLISWIVFGLLAGAVARVIVPGRQAIGCLGTIVIGVAGALLGGLVGEAVLDDDVRFGFDLGPFLLAVVGAAALLLGIEALGRRRR